MTANADIGDRSQALRFLMHCAADTTAKSPITKVEISPVPPDMATGKVVSRACPDGLLEQFVEANQQTHTTIKQARCRRC